MSMFSKYNFFNFKKRTVILFSIFLVVAFFFLVLTKFSQSYTQKIKLRVELTNLNDEVVLLNDSLTIAFVTVRAKGFSLLKYIFDPEQTIAIDAKTEASKQKEAFAWDTKNKKYKLAEVFGKSIEILNINPDTIWFNYDVLASKKVSIQLNKNINYSKGYDVVDKLKLSQDSVKIIGSKSMIDSLSFIPTELLDLNEINSDILVDIKLENPLSGIDIVPENVTVSGTVRRFTEGKFTLPIQIRNAPKNKQINIFPKSVDLIYYVDIENFGSVKPEDFEVICNFKNIKDNTQSSLDITVNKKPASVKSSRLEQSTVEFIISD